MILTRKKIISLLILWLGILNILFIYNINLGILRLVTTGFLLFFVPGWSFSMLIIRSKIGAWHRTFYSIILSLTYLLFGGLAFNTIGPLLGINFPLSPLPFIYFSNLILLIAWFFLYRKLEDVKIKNFIKPCKLDVYFIMLSLLLPILSVASTNILNNYGSNFLSIFLILLIALIVSGVVWKRNAIQSGIFPIIIYFMSLALLLFYSMRSWHILGWDINLEYQVFQLTENIYHWSMSNLPGGEYNACLSITILPTIMHSFLGGFSEYIFKFYMQVLFAIVPVGMFLLYKSLKVESLVGFLATILFISQTWFIEQMPALVRQEVAFIFLIASLVALFDKNLSSLSQKILFILFSFAIVVSHYSTTYIWIITLIIALVIINLLKFLNRLSDKKESIINFRIIIVILFFCFIWTTQLTQTSTSINKFLINTIQRASDIMTTEAFFGGLRQIGFEGVNENSQLNLNNEYKKVYASYSVHGSDANLYVDKNNYAPILVNKNKSIPKLLPDFIGAPLVLVSKIIKFFLVNVFSFFGVILLTIISLRKKRGHNEYIAFCLSAFPLIAMVVFFPFIQEKYNLTRLFMQIFIVLSLPAIIGFTWLNKKFIREPIPLLSILLIIFFFYSVGLTGEITGGGARTTLHQSGGAQDPFYTNETDISSAKWLDDNRSITAPVYSDIIASLRLKGFTSIQNINTELFPTTIYRDSYVYLSKTNVVHGVAHFYFKGITLTYGAPKDFLNEYKNKIYSNGASEIYQ